MKQFVETFSEFINEELIVPSKFFDIYKNPKSIKRMSPWKRAISDDEGNLFIMDDPYFQLVHDDLVRELNKHGEVESSSNYESILGNFVAWMQAGNTNTFYLSESYALSTTSRWNIKNYKKHIDKLTPLVSSKNARFKFVKERIWSNIEQPYSIEDMKSGRIEKI